MVSRWQIGQARRPRLHPPNGYRSRKAGRRCTKPSVTGAPSGQGRGASGALGVVAGAGAGRGAQGGEGLGHEGVDEPVVVDVPGRDDLLLARRAGDRAGGCAYGPVAYFGPGETGTGWSGNTPRRPGEPPEPVCPFSPFPLS
jgi:hypothetical protein